MNWSVSVICILSVILGIWGTLWGFQEVYYSMKLDRDHPDIERIFTIDISNKESETVGNTPIHYPNAQQLLDYIPEIKTISRVELHRGWFSVIVSAVNKDGSVKVLEDDIQYADKAFLNIFQPSIITSFDHEEFSKPGRALLSEDMALKFFTTTDVIGRELIVNYDKSYSIVGLYQPLENSIFSTGILLSDATRFEKDESAPYSWKLDPPDITFSSEIYFLKTSKNISTENLTKRINEFSEEYASSIIVKTEEFPVLRNKDDLLLFVLLSSVILLVVGSNYLNLTMGFTLNLAKEIGIRKIIGSSYSQLIRRVIIQNLVLLLSALIIAIATIKPLYFFLDISINLGFPELLFMLMVIVVLLIFTVLYPAYVLAKVNPRDVLKGGTSSLKISRFARTRISLITLQVISSMVLLTTSIVLFSQTKLWKQTNFNWNTSNIYSIRLPDSDSLKNIMLKDRIDALAGVKTTSIADRLPINHCFGCLELSLHKEDEPLQADMSFIDENYLDLFQLQMSQGSKNYQNYPKSIWISQSISDRLSSDSITSPLGEIILFKNSGSDQYEEGIVSGIFEDIDRGPLVKSGTALALIYDPALGRTLFIESEENKISDIEPQLRAEFENLFPSFLFEGEAISEENLGTGDWGVTLVRDIFTMLFIFAFLITLLGLYGIMTLIGLKRQKEFCIRRIYGGSSSKITLLVIKSFLPIIIPAMIIGGIISHFAVLKFLQSVESQIFLRPIHIFESMVLIIMVLLIIIVLRMMKIMRSNPADVLKVSE